MSCGGMAVLEDRAEITHARFIESMKYDES
jgi:hypothetical protein